MRFHQSLVNFVILIPGNSKLPLSYVTRGEPRAMAGRNKGLSILIEAYSNSLAAGSVNTDFRGFMGLGFFKVNFISYSLYPVMLNSVW